MSERPEHEEQQDLATLKKRGVIDPAGTSCSLCQQEAGDCRPTPIKVMSWVPATCTDCYWWLKDRDLFDEQRHKDLFYPDDELIADGARPEHAVTQTDSKRAIVGALRDVGAAGMATAAVAQKTDIDTKQAGELLRALERESVVEKVGAPGLGGGQWRLVGESE